MARKRMWPMLRLGHHRQSMPWQQQTVSGYVLRLDFRLLTHHWSYILHYLHINICNRFVSLSLYAPAAKVMNSMFHTFFTHSTFAIIFSSSGDGTTCIETQNHLRVSGDNIGCHSLGYTSVTDRYPCWRAVHRGFLCTCHLESLNGGDQQRRDILSRLIWIPHF